MHLPSFKKSALVSGYRGELTLMHCFWEGGSALVLGTLVVPGTYAFALFLEILRSCRGYLDKGYMLTLMHSFCGGVLRSC